MDSFPPYVSYSQLSKWLRCGKLYELSYVQHVPDDPAWWFEAGSAFHLCAEQIDNQLFEKGIV